MGRIKGRKMAIEDDGRDISQEQLKQGAGAEVETGESYDTDSDRGQIIVYAKDPDGMWGGWDTLSILKEPSRLDHMRIESLKHAWERHREFYKMHFGSTQAIDSDGKQITIQRELPLSKQEVFIDKFELKDYKTRTAIEGMARKQLGYALGVPQEEKKKRWNPLRRRNK